MGSPQASRTEETLYHFLPPILEGHLISRSLKYRIRILGQLASVSEQLDGGGAKGDKGPSYVNQVPGYKEPEQERQPSLGPE